MWQSAVLLAYLHVLLMSRVLVAFLALIAEVGSRENADAACRRLTASWVRERATAGTAGDIETCEFFEGHENAGSEALLPAGGQQGEQHVKFL